MASVGFALPQMDAQGAFRVGSIDNIEVKVHKYLPLYWAITCLVSAFRGGWAFLLSLFMHGPCLFSTVLLHEYGHAWQARREGSTVHEILLWPFGGLVFLGRIANPAADLRISLAGPLSHVPQVLLFMILSAAANGGPVTPTGPLDGSRFFGYFFSDWMFLNLFLMIFNLFVSAASPVPSPP